MRESYKSMAKDFDVDPLIFRNDFGLRIEHHLFDLLVEILNGSEKHNLSNCKKYGQIEQFCFVIINDDNQKSWICQAKLPYLKTVIFLHTDFTKVLGIVKFNKCGELTGRLMPRIEIQDSNYERNLNVSYLTYRNSPPELDQGLLSDYVEKYECVFEK